MRIVIDIPETMIEAAKNNMWVSTLGEAVKNGTSLITCKDCVFYRAPVKYSYKETTLYCCRSAITKVSEDDYCSKAERREEA